MPIRLIDQNKPIPWVHPDDRGKPDATVFNIVALTEGKARELRNQFIMGPDAKVPDINAFMMQMFLQCVKSLDNVIMPGESVPRTVSKPEEIRLFLDCIPAETIKPIYEAIQNLTELDAGTLKNSDASPALPRS